MGVEMDQYRTLGDLVEANARNLGDMPATIFEDRTRSHGALANEARNIAAHFAARGLTKGSRVAYLGRNHDRMAVLLIACGFAGCVFTPINWRLSDEELDYVVGNCEASLLFHSREHGPYAAWTMTPHGRPASMPTWARCPPSTPTTFCSRSTVRAPPESRRASN
jgi:acyl-CoA synthetase (AMP-forming)/AMP-acid ligase II